MKKYFLLLVALLGCSTLSRAQVNLEEEFFSLPDSVTNEYLDTLSIKVTKPNDYWMVGAFGGVSLQYGYFNPWRQTKFQLQYPVYGFSFVRHYTMFGMFPNMGFEIGAQMNYEGYEFKEIITKDEEGNDVRYYGYLESGAYKAMIKVPEAFLLSHFHYDIGEYFKLIAKLGLYGGYRTSIHRVLEEVNPEDPYYEQYQQNLQYADAFRDYDKRWTYGVMGGVGFGIMINPFEFHVHAGVKWGWNSYWQPEDPSNKYYYRFAFPLDGTVTFGIYYQLSPRFGHTRAQLRELARKMVAEQQQQP